MKYRGRDVLTNAAADRLIFLENTLKGIIKRFEDEFPDTRESADSAIALSSDEANEKQLGTSVSSNEDIMLSRRAVMASDAEDEADADAEANADANATLRIRPSLSRSNSVLSLTSKALANEEGRVLRAGHKFRSGIVKTEHYALLSGVEMVGADPNHARILHELLDELGDESLVREAKEKGVVRVFQERKEDVLRMLREADPTHWEAFVESQEMARKNVEVGGDNGSAVQ